MATATRTATPGIRAEIRVGDPRSCPVARVSEAADAPSRSVSWSSTTPDGTVVEDFTVEGDAGVEQPDVTEVYRGRGRRRYRFERDDRRECTCARIEDLGFPVADVHARDGALHVTVYVTELEQVREIVDELRQRFGRVSVRQLVRSDDSESRELILVDRSRLTERQLEVIETAFEMGYFGYPKGANAREVAAEIGISPSTFSEHLAAAQSKIMEAILRR